MKACSSSMRAVAVRGVVPLRKAAACGRAGGRAGMRADAERKGAGGELALARTRGRRRVHAPCAHAARAEAMQAGAALHKKGKGSVGRGWQCWVDAARGPLAPPQVKAPQRGLACRPRLLTLMVEGGLAVEARRLLRAAVVARRHAHGHGRRRRGAKGRACKQAHPTGRGGEDERTGNTPASGCGHRGGGRRPAGELGRGCRTHPSAPSVAVGGGGQGLRSEGWGSALAGRRSPLGAFDVPFAFELAGLFMQVSAKTARSCSKSSFPLKGPGQ